MPTLWYGGSFNPIHNGHLICARAVAERAAFDRVVLVPSASPPHKPAARDLAPAHHRAAMCRLAIDGDPMFAVDELELNRTGPSYTIDTVAELKRRASPMPNDDNSHPSTPISWLIGADMLAILPQWHRAEALLAEARFIIMARPGWTLDFDTLPPPFRSLRDQVVQAPLIAISATDIRQRAKQRRPVSYLTPKPVANYIETHGLYR